VPPPPALWAAFGDGDNDVGFALRVEPGALEEDPWMFSLEGLWLSCIPEPTQTGWRFAECAGGEGWLQTIEIDVPAADGEPLSFKLQTLEEFSLETRLKRIPERDEPPASANVELVWQRSRLPASCGSNSGLWAEDGVVYAACFSGIVQILDGATGESLGRAETALAPLGKDSSALEVTVSNDVLFVATTGRGVVSFDVSDPTAPRQIGQFFVDDGDGSANSVTNIHTLTLSPDGKLLFAINQSHPRSDIRIIDVSDPANLRQVGVYLPTTSSRAYGFSHDISLEERDGKLIGYFYQLAGGFHILDATDPADVKELGRLQWPRIFSHSGWPFEANGRRYLAHADEGYDQGLTVIDVTNMAEPSIASTFKTRDGVSIHNIRVVGTTAFISYYLDGLRIIDLSNPAQPREIGHYDTVAPEDEADIFGGAWGVDLDRDLVYISDRNSGVYAFRFTAAP
jgi:hypothetical protein